MSLRGDFKSTNYIQNDDCSIYLNLSDFHISFLFMKYLLEECLCIIKFFLLLTTNMQAIWSLIEVKKEKIYKLLMDQVSSMNPYYVLAKSLIWKLFKQGWDYHVKQLAHENSCHSGFWMSLIVTVELTAPIGMQVSLEGKLNNICHM